MMRLILFLAAAGLLGACASRPQHVEAMPVSALAYLNLECAEISQKVFDTVSEVNEISDQVDQIADDNHIRTTAWWSVFPITMLEKYDSGNSQQALRLRYLKGEYLAAQQAAQFNQCENVKIQPLSAFISNKYYLSEDDKEPYKKSKISSSSRSVLSQYESSALDKNSKFKKAIMRLDTYLKHAEISNQEYRYVVSLLLEKNSNS